MNRMILIAALILSGASTPIAEGATSAESRRPVHTYSIVARDAATGEIGVAVQSHWFSVGSGVVWAEPGVGAVATQSFTDPNYGPLGLALMRAGKSAQQSLEALLAADSRRVVRQVGMVDASGSAANHTGSNSIREHCDATGDGYTVQANLMWKPTVCESMTMAFEQAEGDLAERLMLALEAAQDEGGDMRGKQSAALLGGQRRSQSASLGRAAVRFARRRSCRAAQRNPSALDRGTRLSPHERWRRIPG